MALEGSPPLSPRGSKRPTRERRSTMRSSIVSTAPIASRHFLHPRHRELAVLSGILAASALLNTWNLGSNGWANAFYTAAVQSGLHDGEAFLFGSSDWGNSISVDKPPLSLWLMGISVRVFGFNSWGVLLPQALLGLATTALIYAVVRRRASFSAAAVAAFAFATTPIVVLLSRYNNPDPLMIFLMLAGLEAALRGAESQRIRWFVAAGALLGLAFLTKQLQSFLVVPALIVAGTWGLRLEGRKTLFAAFGAAGAFAAIAGSWLAFVDLTPSGGRPYVGGSTSNSLTELSLGYNGLNRVIDHRNISIDFLPEQFIGGQNDAGLLRLFNANFNQEASWLLLLALVSGAVITWTFRRTPLAPFAAASATWLGTSYFVLSFMGHDIHTYYTISLATPIALAVGLGLEAILRRPEATARRIVIAVGIGLSTLTSWLTLHSLDGGALNSTLGAIALAAGLSGAVLVAVPPPRAWINGVAVAAVATGLFIGPAATDLATLGHDQAGSNPLSGSVTKSPTSISRFLEDIRNNDPAWARETAFGGAPTANVLDLLAHSPPTCRWAAATFPAQTAANWQLASDRAIMPVGGFSGVDPYPTLEQFKALVGSGSVCYFIDYPEMDPIIASQPTTASVVSWVRSTYLPQVVGGLSIYQLNGAT
ncbi:glycosyltransferase family 39 protein [Sinomonas sp. ASV322]|uniref:ArnT family glycosyltransferase n=1 Tax=Sinomonas sp. ASV322 TaxID=3041920 RepID=UPI0027DE5A35|nr:glycosyltransferase family 39 protein [Sinomonas sp. ASV322]MDQ4501884.1 glycosyltransferase family 39 protein [Sinomonas sp. ASV322]